MRNRLLLALVGVVALVLIVHDVPMARHLETVERDRLVTSLQRDAFLIGMRAEEALAADDAPDDTRLRLLVNRFAREEDVRVVIVDRASLGVVASDTTAVGEDFSNRPEISTVLSMADPQTGQRFSETLGEDLFFVSVPVLSGDEVVGAVRLTAPQRVVTDRVRGRVRGIVAVALISLLIAVGVAWVLAATIARPLVRLRLATERLASGDLAARASEAEGPAEIRALAISFNSMAGRLSDLVDRQRAFAGTASHQLRTPLTALRLRLEQLAERLDGDEVTQRTLDATLAETDRLHRMIEGLLALSRAEDAAAGTVAVDLAATVAERVEHWEPLAAEHGVTIVVDVPDGTVVQAIDGAVDQIVDNLVDNALDASPAGGTVLVVSAPHHGRIELHVVDQGPGLSAADRAHAFDRFWRGVGSSPGGSGLGLAIVRQLAVAGGGEAELHADEGGGVDAVVRFRT